MTGKPGSCLFFLLNGQERPSKKVTTDKDIKCISELIICLEEHSKQEKKKKDKMQKPTAKMKPLSGYHGIAGWPVQLEQREGGRGEGGRGQLEMRSEGWLINHQLL